MNTVLLANAISLIGCVLMVVVGLIKKRENILVVQSAQFLILGIANLILGGVTAFISDLVSIGRNLFSLKRPLTTPVRLVFILIQILISVPFNRLGLVGWLPTVAAVSFTMFLDVGDEVVLKLAIIFGQSMWMIFDFLLQNYTSCAFDVFSIISACIGIWRARKASE